MIRISDQLRVRVWVVTWAEEGEDNLTLSVHMTRKGAERDGDDWLAHVLGTRYLPDNEDALGNLMANQDPRCQLDQFWQTRTDDSMRKRVTSTDSEWHGEVQLEYWAVGSRWWCLDSRWQAYMDKGRTND